MKENSLKKKIYVVCLGRITGMTLKEQLDILLHNTVDIEVVLVSEIIAMQIQCDFAIFTSDFLKQQYEKYVHGIPSIGARRLINYKNVGKIITLVAGTDVLLVNDAEHTAVEAIEQLMEIGLNHVNYIPYFPGASEYENVRVAVTPGEMQLVPTYISEVIDIAIRQLDLGTVYEIALKIGTTQVFEQNIIKGYIKEIIEISKKIEKSRKTENETKRKLEAIINGVEDGIAYVNSDGMILEVNRKFESIFSVNKKDIINKDFQTFINKREILSKDDNTTIINIEGNKAIINYEKISIDGDTGYLIIVSLFDRISKLQSSIVSKKIEKKRVNHLSTFEDFLTVNQTVENLIHLTKKFSKTNATILIQGENGAGKEIFAQAIHMDSLRKNNIFVPVNITAIPDKLIESELFGYEEGAFTGAQKGGKAGMFEIAQGGTIFIDEIGDATPELQAKLLRVLQEKRIRRVGGMDEIPVDIRIIAATNKNIMGLMEKGLFREDLFYRLSILPICIPPLREREGDILFLIEHFAKIFLGHKTDTAVTTLFKNDTINFLNEYQWKGNVRELINLMEYVSLTYEGVPIEVEMLPYYFRKEHHKIKKVFLNEEEYWVLCKVRACDNIGRNLLVKEAKAEEVEIGEGKIRRIIADLKAKDLIFSHKKGCSITDKGREVLKQNG